MINKRPVKSFSIGTIAALGIGISSLSSSSLFSLANAVETPVDSKQQNIESGPKHKHNQSANKLVEGMCGSDMQMDLKGMVMHENKDNIPKDCPQISEDVTIDVNAGVKYSEQYPGTVFGFDTHQWQVKPCSRITVNFTNHDDIRHQWMIHGLPRYLYPKGMFHIEVNGKGKKTGTFIIPSSNYTYLVHCDIAQHMEKGMKAQLKAGEGRGDLPSIPGISDPTFFDKF